MNTARAGTPDLWIGFTLRDRLVLGFCASLIVLSGMLLHIPLHLPGHRVLPLVFFLLLGRACVGRAWTATAIGLLAGILALCLGIGGGIVNLLKYFVCGAVADAACLLLPGAFRLVPVSALAGAIAGLSWLPMTMLTDRLVGMDTGLALRHALFKTGSAALFGAIGGALVPGVAKRMRASGLLHTNP